MADTNSQKEYNEVLKVTQSMLGDIKNSMSDIANESDKRNKKLSNEVSINKKILSDLGEKESYSKKINQLEQQKERVSKSNFGVNQKYKQTLLAQLDAQQESLRSAQSMKQVTEKVNDVADDVGSSFKNTFDGIQSSLESIPIFGKMLGKTFEPLKENANRISDVAAHKFKTRFESSFISAKEGGASFTKSLSSGLQGGTKAAVNFGKAAARMLGTLGVAILAIGAALMIGIKRFQEIEQAAANFRAETGLLNSQTRQLQTNIQQVSGTMAGLGVSAQDVSKAASDFTNEFQGLEQPSKSVLTSMVALNKNFGIGTQEASKLNKVFQNIGGLTATQSQALIGQTVEMAKMAGVAPSKVIKDMADNSEVAYQFFGGSVKELAAAAVEAAAMGTSIAEAGKAARGLLDYQSSVSKELEASAILGTNINLSQARYLAANGKALESQQAVLDSVSQLGDLTKLNVYEQEALAEATNMEFSSLVNQQRIRERFGKLKKEELAAAQSLLDSGRDLSNLTKADLDAQNQRLKGQQELQSQTSRFSNAMSGIGTAFMDMFAPIADFLMPVLADIGEVLNNVISPIFRVIGSVIGAILAPLGFVLDILGAILVPISEFAGYLIDGIAKPFNHIIEMFNGFGSIITQMGMWFDENLIQPLVRAYEIGSSIASTLTFGLVGSSGTESGTSVTSVNDAVISPSGDIVSTHPDDFLIATKTPETLGGGGTVNMSGVISELKSLREAFVSNKDVYIDGDRVTAKVTMRQESSGKNQFGMSGA